MKTKTHIIAATIALSLCTTPVLANDKNEFEAEPAIGFGAGLVFGAATGGPLGAIIGGTVGALIGFLQSTEEDNNTLSQSLTESQQQIANIEHDNQLLNNDLASLQNKNAKLHQQLTQIQQHNISSEALAELDMNLQFKVGSSHVETLYHEQIKQIAALVKQNPDLQINLAGFSDRSGDEVANLALSEKRIIQVKKLLIDLGVQQDNIISQAHGENSPIQAQQDYQNDFFDRRVAIKIQPQMTAAND
jgi:sortase system peptidoglycan-associated protein